MDLMANLYNFCTLCLTANYLRSAEFINLDYGAMAPVLRFLNELCSSYTQWVLALVL
jgi:hypothetical protein